MLRTLIKTSAIVFLVLLSFSVVLVLPAVIFKIMGYDTALSVWIAVSLLFLASIAIGFVITIEIERD